MTDPEPRDLRREHCDDLSSATTRWADNDMLGHLNNAVYLELFDTAINAWMVAETGIDERLAEAAGRRRPVDGPLLLRGLLPRQRRHRCPGAGGPVARASSSRPRSSSPGSTSRPRTASWVQVYIGGIAAPGPSPRRAARRASSGASPPAPAGGGRRGVTDNPPDAPHPVAELLLPGLARPPRARRRVVAPGADLARGRPRGRLGDRPGGRHRSRRRHRRRARLPRRRRLGPRPRPPGDDAPRRHPRAGSTSSTPSSSRRAPASPTPGSSPDPTSSTTPGSGTRCPSGATSASTA